MLKCAIDGHLDAVSQCHLNVFKIPFYEKPADLGRNTESSI